MRSLFVQSGLVVTTFALALAAAGCSSSDSGSNAPQTDAEWRASVTTNMHEALLGQINVLAGAAKELQDEAPTAAWNGAADRSKIDAMKASWVKARVAYEHIEGALAPLFPEIDASIDARYEDFLDALNGKGDTDLFDGEGVTGMHAIERILWADSIPAAVVQHESTDLAAKGYVASSFPTTDAQAVEFKTKLVQRLIDDTNTLASQWTPQKIDVSGAFTGLVALMNEQREKVNKAASSEEESRYSQRTMADIRANLEGTENVYAIFQPWIKSKDVASDARILAGFDRLHTAYVAVSGDAIPQPPASWQTEDVEANSQADKDSPFGKLYFEVNDAVDMKIDSSIVSSMNGAAKTLGFSEFSE